MLQHQVKKTFKLANATLVLPQLLSCVQLFATPWTAAHQAPPCIGLPRQDYQSGLSFPSPGYRLDPGTEPGSPALQADSLPNEPTCNIISSLRKTTKKHILSKKQSIKCQLSFSGALISFFHQFSFCTFQSTLFSAYVSYDQKKSV